MLKDPNDFRADSYLAQPGCRIYEAGGAFILTTATPAAITFDTVRYDPYGMWAAANSERITVTIPGRYVVGGHGQFQANATGERQLNLRINGTDAIAMMRVDAAGSGTTRLTVSTIWDFVSGDYVELVAFQNSGGDLNIETNSSWSPGLYVQRVG